MRFNKVAVLMGGMSGERSVSLQSGGGVLAALQSQGVNALAFDPAERSLFELKKEGFDACFINLHGRFGEDGTVQGALELMQIPYTGSGVMASAIGMDKVMTKRVWQAEGIPTPASMVLSSERILASQGTDLSKDLVEKLGLPLIVKPAREGSSLGVYKVENEADVVQALREAAAHDAAILCESCIIGEELTCAVLGAGEQARALPLIRIVAPEGNYDFENKYIKNDTQYLIPCGLPQAETEAIERYVLQAYRSLACRGWGRVDVMVDAKTRKPYLLEVNTSPGMTSHSLVPKAALATGLGYEKLCLEILQAATLDARMAGQV